MSKGTQPYNYFDVPDGEDIGKKVWHVAKPVAKAASFLAICDVVLYSHPKGYLKTIGRMAAVSIPIVAVASTAVLVTNLAGSLRKTSDKKNWFIGGFASGALLGAVFRSPLIGFNTGMLFGTALLIRKDMHDTYGGDVVIQDIKTNRHNHWTVHQDWSLLHDPPKGWTTGQ